MDIPIKRNEEYVHPGTHPNPGKLIAAAVLQNGKIWTGRRHSELIYQVSTDGGEYVTSRQQGFLAENGEFIMRRGAMEIAIKNGQVEPNFKSTLTSEDLW